MSRLSRRQESRIRFRTRLRIKEHGAGRAIDATCLDLSQGGMGVRAAGVCAVGSDVVCELQVEGEALSLPGVVAWILVPDAADGGAVRQPRPTKALFELGSDMDGPEDAAASKRPDTKTLVRLGGELAILEPGDLPDATLDATMGIRFQALGDAQAQVLTDLVREGEPVTSPLQVWFSGLAEPIAARAEASADGIRLRTALPFLALDSHVRFRFGSDEEQHGRVLRVELGTDAARRVPRLEIAIAAGLDANGPRACAAAPPQGAQAKVPAHVSRPSLGIRLWTGLMMATLGAGLGAASTYLWLVRPAGHARVVPAVRNAPPPVPEPEVAAAVMLEVPAPSEPAQSGPASQAQAPSSAALDIQPDRLPMLEGSEAAPSLPVEPPTPTTGSAAEQISAAGPQAPPTEAPAPASNGLTAPQVYVLGAATRIFIPAEGSDADISRYDLSSPGIVVNLPHARAGIPLLDYPIYRGMVRRIWLREHRDGVQVRIVWRPGPAHCKVVFNGHGLTLTVRP